MFCSKCGAEVVEGAVFCQKCGAKLNKEASAVQPEIKSDTATSSKTPGKKKNWKILGIFAGVLVIVAAVALIWKGHIKYPDELLFDGVPATEFFEMTRDDIIEKYGESDETTFEGISVYDAEGIYRIAYSGTTDKAIYIEFSVDHCTFNGKKLNKTPDKARKVLASSEEPFETFFGSFDMSSDSVHVFWGNAADCKYNTYRRTADAYTIDCIYTTYGEEEMFSIAIYEDEWIEICDKYNPDGLTGADMSNDSNADINILADDDVYFSGIPVSGLLNASAAEVKEMFGENYYADENDKISYYMIDFYLTNDGWVNKIWSFYPEYFGINGYELVPDSEGVIAEDEIIELLGQDYTEEFLESGYYLTYYFQSYKVSFGVDKYSCICDIIVSSFSEEEGENK
ncbi:MAG: zinc-ribbon domain-containing protein [Eubacteriales bacterium]|nr:zinc-ribbon domain-containing protein [Eubacteriales bacterium]